MKKNLRLSSEERRESILKTARKIFSERGFHGTTTRELALEAEVSEALLFKYFPTKEAIYNAMLLSCKQSPSGEEFERLLALKPSTATLIVMVHHILAKNILTSGESCIVGRLLIRSLSEDGSFGRIVMQHFGETWVEKLAECIRAAERAGDLEIHDDCENLAAWFCQHLALALMLINMPDKPVINYGKSKIELAEQAVQFVLRGIGMSEKAIRKHYEPAALELLMS